jgi:putative inorganic carbon (HCO3(-)) transporter
VWLVRLGAFLLPLVVLWSMNDQVILPKLLAARFLILLLVALLLTRWLRAEIKIRRTPLDLPILAYVASAGVSTIFAANVNLAFFGTYGRLEGFLTIATYSALFWLTAQAIPNLVEARNVLRALLAGALVVSVVAIFQAVAGTLTAAPSGESAAQFGGVARATATFGNANGLAAYLAMALPLGVNEYLQAAKRSDRVLAGNLVAMMTIALLLTFGRGGWVGATVGVVVVMATTRQSLRRAAVIAGAAVALLGVIGLTVTFLGASGPPIAQSTAARLLSLLDPITGSGATRLHIWKDTLGLIASRPLVGYGPDTFGLVFPQFQTGPWAGAAIIDEAHSELLQVGATQGLFGLIAFSWLCIAVLRLWWNGRRQILAGGVLGAWAGYLITSLVNFSVVPASLPFWMFLGAGAAILRADADLPATAQVRHRGRPLPLAVVLIALAIMPLPTIGWPYAADSRFREALTSLVAGDRGRAVALVLEARAAQPQEPLYAAEAGNLAMAGADWAAAREAYMRAAQLGSFNPSVFRQLAIADEHLGLKAEAVAAARRSVELNRFDPENLAVLHEVASP